MFALPAYLFIGAFLGIIAVASARLVLDGARHAVIPPPPLGHATQAVGWWLLLRTFAAGCTAMSGVEAVSNGVNAFTEPVIRHAHATLTVICVALGLLLSGLVFSAGVIFLALTGGGLLSVFGRITDRLIPLFAIGAFLTFTISQAGMVVVHWHRAEGRNAWRPGVNALGAATMVAALYVILVAKFLDGT